MRNIQRVDCVFNARFMAISSSLARQDTLQTKQGDNSFCVSFKVGKPPINIVFFIYRVFNNGTYPIVFSINSYVSVYSSDAPLCTQGVQYTLSAAMTQA